MKGKIKETNHHIKVIQGARKDATMAMSVWRNSDGFKSVEWHNIAIAADALLQESEPPKKLVPLRLRGSLMLTLILIVLEMMEVVLLKEMMGMMMFLSS